MKVYLRPDVKLIHDPDSAGRIIRNNDGSVLFGIKSTSTIIAFQHQSRALVGEKNCTLRRVGEWQDSAIIPSIAPSVGIVGERIIAIRTSRHAHITKTYGLTVRRSRDRKSTRLNSSHPSISYAVF